MARTSAKGACGHCRGTWTDLLMFLVTSSPPPPHPAVSQPARVLHLLGGRCFSGAQRTNVVDRSREKTQGGYPRGTFGARRRGRIGLPQTSVSLCRKWEHKL